MTNGFVKNEDLLKEDSHTDDLLDFTKLIKIFSQRIYNISKPSIIGLVGKFGCGKSTMLNQIMKNKKDTEIWIEFDAWKYPERKDLWEGFVLDCADQLGEKNKVVKKIDGKPTKTTIVDIGTDILSIISSKLVGFNLLDKFVDIFKTSPAKRVFEIQEILKGLLLKQEKDIFIIIEDIDRSGDSGVYFLETLKQFMRNINLNNRKFVVIVPIGNDSYYKNLNSYIKTIDYFDFFEEENISLTNFVDSIFDDELFTGEEKFRNNQLAWNGTARRQQIISFLEQLFIQFPDMTVRLLKLILRKSNIVYKSQVEDGLSPDFRVSICFEAMKYFYIDKEKSKTFFEEYKKEQKIESNSIFAAFLWVMLRNENSLTYKKYNQSTDKEIFEIDYPRIDFKCIHRGQKAKEELPSYPWTFQSFGKDERDGLGITSFYLEY